MTDSFGCIVTSFVEEFTFSDDSPCATGIDEYGLTMDVYPNPSTGVFTVNYSLDHQTELRLMVFDLMGKQVTDNMNITSMSGTTVIDLSNESEGVYLLKIAIGKDKVLQERLMLVK
jgi:hypothetical protein